MPPLTATPAPGPTTARATDRVLPTTVARRERAGSAFAPPARRRIFRLPPARLRVILMRDGDVPPTVDAGVADAGRTGSDVIEELGHHLYEALDRGGGRGRRVLAGPLSRASRKPRPARGRAVGAAGAARRTVA